MGVPLCTLFQQMLYAQPRGSANKTEVPCRTAERGPFSTADDRAVNADYQPYSGNTVFNYLGNILLRRVLRLPTCHKHLY
jgi:hypothetical protein